MRTRQLAARLVERRFAPALRAPDGVLAPRHSEVELGFDEIDQRVLADVGRRDGLGIGVVGVGFYDLLPCLARNRYRNIDVDTAEQPGVVLNPGRPKLLVVQLVKVFTIQVKGRRQPRSLQPPPHRTRISGSRREPAWTSQTPPTSTFSRLSEPLRFRKRSREEPAPQRLQSLRTTLSPSERRRINRLASGGNPIASGAESQFSGTP